MGVYNASLMNFIYQSGNDRIAIKPHSYNVLIRTVTCNGGNGMAIDPPIGRLRPLHVTTTLWSV
ncbi:hypothetical protein B0J12DRAFT_735823 [Macrophomina phaseolina]|uniref:Uncharacterized protein n=1 Tax=Macrophomina phaseolina TaxID=35725 RepID=A0ABQ8GPZ4_9PEZI|nr:hypothetical protein B0J12DRAFT_735823 [Macrophomina phaseolina]